MKFIAVILAVLVSVLTTIPCDSSCGELTDVEAQFHTPDEHRDHAEADNCSPFCVCNCCQTNIVLIETTNEISDEFTTIVHISKVKAFNSTLSFDLWRPPKV